MSEAALSIKDLNVEYVLKKGSHPAVKNISFQVEQGEIFGLVGESGSGKSTLLHILGGLAHPDAGKILIHGQNIVQMEETEIDDVRNSLLKINKINFPKEGYLNQHSLMKK